jgi:hypothetical protein
MKQPVEPRTKKCPVCKREFPEEDNYCGDDGSLLEQASTSSGRDGFDNSGRDFFRVNEPATCEIDRIAGLKGEQ